MSSIAEAQVPTATLGPFRDCGEEPAVLITEYLEKPLLDDRLYRIIKLPNGLEVLLVQNLDTKWAAAAMDVNIGSFNDPFNIPGLAHYVEHMLFQGTKEYPEQGGFIKFITSQAGDYKAVTLGTSTNFRFKIAAQAGDADALSPLHGALHRFASFFVGPLFPPLSLAGEVKIIDSELARLLPYDGNRIYQLEKSLSNPNHPYSKFNFGNIDTLETSPKALGLNIRQECVEFWKSGYSADRMKLVVTGQESLDTLQAWATEMFAKIQNKGVPQNRWENEQPYGKQELLTICFAKPIMEYRYLQIRFPFLNEDYLYETQPSSYICYLISHQGPGSIHFYLDSKGWTEDISAEAYAICPGTWLFDCTISLTPEGIKNHKEVIKAVFGYIALLRNTPPQEWIFEEQKSLADLGFRFAEKGDVLAFTHRISGAMQDPIPRQWLLKGRGNPRKFDQLQIKEGLSYLRPDNFNILVVSKDIPGSWDKEEHWFGTEYQHNKISNSFLWEIEIASTGVPAQNFPEFQLPPKNEFIPTSLNVEIKDIEVPEQAPRLIRNDNLIRAWYKKDDQHWMPKANIYILFKNPLVDSAPANWLKTAVYIELIKSALKKYRVDIEKAGLWYSIDMNLGNLEIQVAGYNDKVLVLLEKVLMTMRDLVINLDRFEIVKERLLRNQRDYDSKVPYEQVEDFTTWLGNERGFINDQMLTELEPLNLEDVQTFFSYLLRQMHIETLVHGNLFKEDALRVNNLVESVFTPSPLPTVNIPVARSLIFPPGSNFRYCRTLRVPDNLDNCIVYFLFVGELVNYQLLAMVLLLEQLTTAPAYNQFREKEQLGYIVKSDYFRFDATMGYRFLIQSKKGPVYLESRIDEFLEGYGKTLEDMTRADFQDNIRSLIVKLRIKFENLDQESGHYWSHIKSGDYAFESLHIIAEQVAAIGKPEIVEFFRRYISPSSPARAKLAIHLYAKGVSGGSTPSDATVTQIVEKKVSICFIRNVKDYKSKLAVTASLPLGTDLSELEDIDGK